MTTLRKGIRSPNYHLHEVGAFSDVYLPHTSLGLISRIYRMLSRFGFELDGGILTVLS